MLRHFDDVVRNFDAFIREVSGGLVQHRGHIRLAGRSHIGGEKRRVGGSVVGDFGDRPATHNRIRDHQWYQGAASRDIAYRNRSVNSICPDNREAHIKAPLRSRQ